MTGGHDDNCTGYIASAKQRLALALRPRIALIGLTSAALAFPGDPEDRIAVTDRISHADAAGSGAEAWSAATVALVTALSALALRNWRRSAGREGTA